MTGDIEEPEALICHLKELVDSYEELVQDLTGALSKSKEEFKALESTTTTTTTTDRCQHCENSEKVIQNLKAQIESLSKAKKVTTALWQSSAEQIERLELRLRNLQSSSSPVKADASRPHVDDQIKLLQSYVARLESRIEQASSEKNFYRKKLMESKLESQAALKNVALEKQKEIELVKATYIKEIDHLKSILEKERQLYQSSIDKRLEDARKFWASEEKQRRDTLKKNWLAQIEPILLEQERLLLREAHLSEKLYQTQQELIQTKQLLWDAPVVAAFRSTQQRGGGDLHQRTAGASKDGKKLAGKHNDEEDDDKTDKSRAHLRSCDHEECVRYSMHIRVLHENERLGEEISSLRRAKQTLELDNQKSIQRLESRIRELENLNHKLQEQLLILTSWKESGASLDQLPTRIKALPPAGDQDNLSSHYRVEQGETAHLKKQRKPELEHDPVLNLVDEFSQLCNLHLDQENRIIDTRAETDARVQHLEQYARELQLQKQRDRQQLTLREQSIQFSA